MKTRIILVCLAIMTILAHADELKDLLGKKEVEYVGVCRLDARGMLVFSEKETKSTPECIVVNLFQGRNMAQFCTRCKGVMLGDGKLIMY
jgi:hypothetical protein